MITTPIVLDLPLHTDEHEVIRVSGTRVTLHTLLRAYLQGDSPEAIHEGFPTVPLADIYAVIAYYLANRAEVDAYLTAVDEAGESLRREWEARYTPAQRARIDEFKRLAEEKRKASQP